MTYFAETSGYGVGPARAHRLTGRYIKTKPVLIKQLLP